jgi:hypothetical protein
MEEQNIEAVDSVTTHEEEVVEVDERDSIIADLQDKLKIKSIQERKAKKETKPDIDSSVLERVQRMELKENGLKDSDEIELVLKKSKELKLDPLVLVSEGLAEGLLERHRKAKQDELATPGTSSRTASSQKDSVDYWIAKGELPSADKVELRREVVKKKIKASNRSNMFNYSVE